jgi:hypothetical protein
MKNRKTLEDEIGRTSDGFKFKSGDAVLHAVCPYCKRQVFVDKNVNGAEEISQNCPHYRKSISVTYTDGSKKFQLIFGKVSKDRVNKKKERKEKRTREFDRYFIR